MKYLLVVRVKIDVHSLKDNVTAFYPDVAGPEIRKGHRFRPLLQVFFKKLTPLVRAVLFS